jgi:hypothetical protein
MFDNFVPLATHSGFPHLSNEQRADWERNKAKNMAIVSPFFESENYNRFFGEFDNFQKWRITDLIHPCIHPIHLLHVHIQTRIESLIDKQEALKVKLITKEIDEEEWNNRQGLLNFYFFQVIADVDLGVKRKYKEMLRQLKSGDIVYKDVEPLEKSSKPLEGSIQQSSTQPCPA